MCAVHSATSVAAVTLVGIRRGGMLSPTVGQSERSTGYPARLQPLTTTHTRVEKQSIQMQDFGGGVIPPTR